MSEDLKSSRAWKGKVIQTDAHEKSNHGGSQTGVTNFRYEYAQDSYRVFHNGKRAYTQVILTHGLGHVEK